MKATYEALRVMAIGETAEMSGHRVGRVTEQLWTLDTHTTGLTAGRAAYCLLGFGRI